MLEHLEIQIKGLPKCKQLVELICLYHSKVIKLLCEQVIINLQWWLQLHQVTYALSGLMEATHCSALPLCSTYFASPKLARQNRSFGEDIDFVFVVVINYHRGSCDR